MKSCRCGVRLPRALRALSRHTQPRFGCPVVAQTRAYRRPEMSTTADSIAEMTLMGSIT